MSFSSKHLMHILSCGEVMLSRFLQESQAWSCELSRLCCIPQVDIMTNAYAMHPVLQCVLGGIVGMC